MNKEINDFWARCLGVPATEVTAALEEVRRITSVRPPCEGKTPCLKIMGDYEQSKSKCLPLFNQGRHYYGYPAWLTAIKEFHEAFPEYERGMRLMGIDLSHDRTKDTSAFSVWDRRYSGLDTTLIDPRLIVRLTRADCAPDPLARKTPGNGARLRGLAGVTHG